MERHNDVALAIPDKKMPLPALQIAVLLVLQLIGGLNGTGSSGPTPMTESDLEFVLQKLCVTQCPPDTHCVLAGTKLITRLTVLNLDSCKMFCWYTENCYSFSYKTRSNLCGLFFELPSFKLDYEIPYKHSDYQSMANTFDSLGDMDCVINYESNPTVPCRSFQEILEASKTSNGILIKHVFGGLCLDFGKALTLDWSDCTSAILWRLQQIPVPSKDLPNSNSIALKFIKADSPSECMTATWTGRKNVVAVSFCKEGRADQVFEVSRGSLEGLRQTSTLNVNECYFRISNQYSYLYTGEAASNADKSGLNLVSMLLPSEHRSLCARRFFQERSRGLIEGTAPFFLPGSSISVTCKPGYVFRQLDYVSTEIDVTCLNERTYLDLPTCTELDGRVKPGNDDISVATVDISESNTSSAESDPFSSATPPSSASSSSSSPSSVSSSWASTSVAKTSNASKASGESKSRKKVPEENSQIEKSMLEKLGLFLTVSVIGNFGQLLLLLSMGVAIFALLHKIASLKADQCSTEKNIKVELKECDDLASC